MQFVFQGLSEKLESGDQWHPEIMKAMGWSETVSGRKVLIFLAFALLRHIRHDARRMGSHIPDNQLTRLPGHQGSSNSVIEGTVAVTKDSHRSSYS